MEFLDKKIEEYIQLKTTNESELLSKLNRETWAKVLMPRMLSGHVQGRVLSLFSNLIKPNKEITHVLTIKKALEKIGRKATV